MDRAPTAAPATAREIIHEIVRNMREGLEPLHFSTLAPSVYHVYLHPDDLDRLRAIVPRIVQEAQKALDKELERLNRAGLVERLKIARRGDPKVEAPAGGWQISLLENTDDDISPGDIVIHSELAMPRKADLGAGSMTKRISTRRIGGLALVAKEAPPAVALEEPVTAESELPTPPEPLIEEGAFAVITYEDKSGPKTYQMKKDEIVVGRGGRDYWTDLKLEAAPDVSREHFRLRRDPNSGKFFLKDLSRLGTTVNGRRAPSSVEIVDGQKRDRNVEAPVPDRARIGLADVIFLEFRTAAAEPRS